MTEPVAIGAIVVLVIGNVGSWIKEWRRGKNNENGNLLKDIYKTVGTIKTNVVEISAKQESQEKHCKQTTEMFREEIVNNRDKIFDVIKDRK